MVIFLLSAVTAVAPGLHPRPCSAKPAQPQPCHLMTIHYLLTHKAFLALLLSTPTIYNPTCNSNLGQRTRLPPTYCLSCLLLQLSPTQNPKEIPPLKMNSSSKTLTIDQGKF